MDRKWQYFEVIYFGNIQHTLFIHRLSLQSLLPLEWPRLFSPAARTFAFRMKQLFIIPCILQDQTATTAVPAGWSIKGCLSIKKSEKWKQNVQQHAGFQPCFSSANIMAWISSFSNLSRNISQLTISTFFFCQVWNILFLFLFFF